MDDYPSNSHNRRDLPRPVEKKADDVPAEKRVERIIDGDVIRRKKPLGRRFKETFFGSDSQSVWQYVVMDVLIPAAKDMVADATSQGIERMLFGEEHHYGRRGGRRGGRNARTSEYTNYTRYSRAYDDRPPFPPIDRRREVSRRARATHNFDDIILATRAEGEEVLDRLYDLLEKYETATVSDLYGMLGLSGAYTDDKWGWTDLRGSQVRHTANGYLLDIPNPEPLD